MEKRPVLISLTGPSAGGKSTILADLQGLGVTPIVSTTTRAPRVGEIEGKDYYFISVSESHRLEQTGSFIELVELNGIRYGVTKAEMRNKLVDSNVCAIVLDPEGAKIYGDICAEEKTLMYKVFVDTDVNTRIKRLEQRFLKDLKHAVASDVYQQLDTVTLLVGAYTRRLTAAVGEEQLWFSKINWDMIAFGDSIPQEQAFNILKRALATQTRDVEVRDFIFSKPHLHIGK